MIWDEIRWPEELHQPSLDEKPPTILLVQTVEQLPEKSPSVIIPGVVRQGEIILIGGHSKSWKSWALLDLLYCVANGMPWFSFPAVIGSVLHIDLELADWDIRHRFTAIQKSYNDGSFDNIRVVAHRGKKLGLGDLEQVSTELKELNFALISLDPTYRLLADENENEAGVITELMNKFLELGTSLQAAIALLQHFSKGNQSDKEPLDRFSGSGVWARHPDALVMFSQHEDENAFTINFVFRSFPPIEPFVVKWEFPRFRLASELDPDKLRQSKGGRPQVSSAEKLCSLVHADETICYSDFFRRAHSLSGLSEATFKRRLKDAKNQELLFLSPINNEYALTSNYAKRNGNQKIMGSK
jgi:hypothetical protein